jgi:beta-glucosidase
MANRSFPADFVWGTATASYQIEGAVREDGRKPSIWDTFSHTPGATLNGDTGDVACDHYHRWQSDLDMLSGLGIQAYRFSIAWPRVQPDGSGGPNQAGIDFYSRLVDGLLERDIKPVATLYHWDLPQALEDAGGWPARDTAYRFADYASIIVRALGDRVDTWTTLNEPWCVAFLGYAAGHHAPGRTEEAAALAAAHHLNLGHGLAGRVVREVAPASKLSVTHVLSVLRAATDSAADADVLRRADDVANGIYLGPMLRGAYPERLFADTAHVTDWSFVQDGDTEIANVPLDVLGLNYYFPTVVRHRQLVPGSSAGTTFVGIDDVEVAPPTGKLTTMGWPIDETGMTQLLLRIHGEFPGLPTMITENGAAFPDPVAADGRVHDADRIDYLYRHIDAVGAAMDAGADVRAYFVWSLMDNFEWAYGFDRRFGIVHVDYDTQQRTPKDSAYWYRDLITSRSLPSPSSTR